MAILGAFGYKKPTTNTRYSRPPKISSNRYSPMSSRSVASYGTSPSRFKQGSYQPSSLNIPSRPISNPVNFQGGFNPNANIFGGSPPTPPSRPGSSINVNPFSPQGGAPGNISVEQSGSNIFSTAGNAIERFIQGLFGGAGSIQGTPGTAEQYFGNPPSSDSNIDYQPRQYQGAKLSDAQVIANAQDKYALGLEMGRYGQNDPQDLWDKLINPNINNPIFRNNQDNILGVYGAGQYLPGGEFSGMDPFGRDQGIVEEGGNEQIPWWEQMGFPSEAAYWEWFNGQQQHSDEGEYGDPQQQAQDYLNWMKQQRVSGVNSAVDAYIEQLNTEKGRVGPYYDQLRRGLGVTRGASLEGSAATEAGVNREYTRDRLGLVDLKDQMRQDTQQNLAGRGMLNSGAADKAFRNIDKVVTSAVASAMKDKNIKISDILEGKENVQNVYTTAIKDAQEQQQQYLEGIEKEITSAEGQRGQDILNIGNELTAQLPILSRELSNDQFSRNMQKANLDQQMRIAMMGAGSGRSGGASGPSWMDQAMMDYRYADMEQEMAIALMNQQGNNQPNWGGLFGSISGAGNNELQSLIRNSGLAGNALNIDPRIIQGMAYPNMAWNNIQGSGGQYDITQQGYAPGVPYDYYAQYDPTYVNTPTGNLNYSGGYVPRLK